MNDPTFLSLNKQVVSGQSSETPIYNETYRTLPSEARVLAESERLRIDPSRLQDLPEYDVMNGGFGTVRVAKLDDQIVAVKELRISGTRIDRGHIAMRFARELKVWAPLNHPNILKLSGFYIDAAMSMALFICPFYTHGHIRNFIITKKPDNAVRLKLAEDTALGLRYLHELQIAHGDLKELNVLVDPEPRALLCDYGLSKMVNPDGSSTGLTTTGMNMTVRFASPEIVNGSRPDLPSDIWAWGCVFLKIISDVEPYDGTSDVACIMKIVQGIPPVDVSTLSMVASLRDMLTQCWTLEPSARPNIEQCIKIIESLAPQKPEPIPIYLSPGATGILGTNCGDVHSVAFSPNGLLLASASNDGNVRVWSVESGALVATLDCGAHVWAVSFSSNGKQLSCGLNDASVTIWDATSDISSPSSDRPTIWVQKVKLPAESAACSIAFSPDSSRLAAGLGLRDGKVQVWDGISGKPLFSVEGDGSETRGLAFSPDGRWLAFCSWGTAVWIQDVAAAIYPKKNSKWTPVVKLEGHTAEAGSVAFSPNGRWLASAGLDQTIIVRNVPAWTVSATLKGKEWIISLAFSPDSTMVAAGTLKGNIQIWDIKSRRLLSTFKAHEDSVRGVAFSPDGKWIASGSMDHTVRLWQVTFSAASDSPVDPLS